MQHHAFMPGLGIDDPFKEFWPKTHEIAKEHDMDEVLAYMHLMLHEANYKKKSLRREAFIKDGKGIAFFNGVETWFDRINKYAADRGIEMQHYIISSGLREIIEGTSIYKYMKHVYASGFMYNHDGIAIWPATAVNYTNKTQHLFRINKGILNSWDNKTVNKFMPEQERPVPFPQMVYIGDGDTDIPAMKMIKHYNGIAIAVYDPSKIEMKQASDDRVTQNRADYSFAADYSEGSEIDLLIKAKIDALLT